MATRVEMLGASVFQLSPPVAVTVDTPIALPADMRPSLVDGDGFKAISEAAIAAYPLPGLRPRLLSKGANRFGVSGVVYESNNTTVVTMAANEFPPPAEKVGEAALLALAAEQTNPAVLVVVYAGRATALTSLATTVSVCYPRVWTQLTTFFGAASVVDPDYGLPTLDQLSDQLAVAYGTELRRNRFTAFHRAHVRPCLDHSVGYPAVAYGLIKAMNNRRTYPKIAVSPEGLPRNAATIADRPLLFWWNVVFNETIDRVVKIKVTGRVDLPQLVVNPVVKGRRVHALIDNVLVRFEPTLAQLPLRYKNKYYSTYDELNNDVTTII